MPQIGRPVLVQIVLMLALVATTVAGGYTAVERLRALNAHVFENTIWLASRLEVEHQDFVLAAQHARMAQDEERAARIAQMILNFDIYFSRVDTVVAFTRERALDRRAGEALAAGLREIMAYRNDMADLVDRAGDDVASLSELAVRAPAMAAAHRAIAVEILQTDVRITEQDRKRDERALQMLAGLFALLIVLLGSLVVILIGMNGSLGRHVARARAARDRLQGIINVAPAAILLTDAEGRVRELNNVAADLLGLTRETAIGRPLGDFLDPLKAFGAPEAAEEEQRRLKLRTGDGRRVPVEVASTPVAAIAPELDRLIALRDMSDYVRLEANLKRSQLEAHYGASERARFAADWNHRLRTPVQTILSVLDICAANAENANVKAGIASAHAAAREIMEGLGPNGPAAPGAETVPSAVDDCPPADPGAELPVVLRRMNILVVEDHPQNRALLCDLVGSLGHRPVPASSGEEAVALAGETGFDLVLMDIGLPGIDGVEATRQIRRNETGTHRATICAVSAHSRMLESPRLLTAGMDRVILKPLRRDALAQLIAGAAAPAAAPAQPSPELDTAVLDELVEQIGADRVVGLFDGLFLETQSAIDAARAWLEGGDAARARDEAHRTAGLAGLVGAQELLGALSSVESSADHDDRDTGAAAIAACVEALEATRAAWERFD